MLSIRLRVDYSGKELIARNNDAVFVYAEAIDANGTIVPDFSERINFTVNGDAEIGGQDSSNAEAGIATIIIRAGVTMFCYLRKDR